MDKPAPLNVPSSPVNAGKLPEDVDQLKEQLAKVLMENKVLRRQVLISEFTTFDHEEMEAKGEITKTEVAAIHDIFTHFDTDDDNRLNLKELKALHEKLGEPLTDKEAEAALAEIDTEKLGYVSFEAFLDWWIKDHNRQDRYESKFKTLRAKALDNFNLANLHTISVGKLGTLEYRVQFHYKKDDKVSTQISPWHDIPLYADELGGKEKGMFHFVCEIPKWTRAKYEIATGEEYNPIKQDVKNGLLRYHKHGDFMFNYGAFPQTWEDPNHITKETGVGGDNDPIDVIDIGVRQLKTGQVVVVKVIGVLALIDSKETDWKLIVINIDDPLAHKIHTVEDAEKYIPGAIDAIREYLRVYKVCLGSPENAYGYEGKCMPKETALMAIEETAEFWQALMKKNTRTLGKK